ncbi:MAG: serine/threonine-protein phosphatase [Bacteroidetes bacterium]|nr:MAG: serine/threonine-protein phosphatase [Bacteroidota bacterium]
MQQNYVSQRNTYKLLEKLTSQKFKTEISLLKSLVKDVVNHKEFGIIGGRIWELNPQEYSYNLCYQFGKVDKIPKGYSLSIENQPVLNKLLKQRTILNYESDELLKLKGIYSYSITGVGELIRLRGGKYYKYALAFNSPEMLQSFYETLNIISGIATIAIRGISGFSVEKKIRRDLFKASEIQRNLLPEHKIRFLDYDIYGICTPDSEVGGDYFDYLRNVYEGEENLGIVIADASSKGLPAAIQALFVSGAIRMGTRFATKITHLFSRLNTLIWETFVYERFVTLFYCELTQASNRLLLYANAGHCAPIHYRPANDSFMMLEATGAMLGLTEHQSFRVENIRMHPGDVLVLYTDGITESQDENGLMYGEERLLELIRKNYNETSENIALAIIEDVQKYTSESLYNDDKTLVVIKRDLAEQPEMTEISKASII